MCWPSPSREYYKMDVNFVCRANLGRSQMAQTMFNRLSRHRITSTGIMVLEMEGQTLAERADVAPSVVLVLELMSEEKTWTFPQRREPNSLPSWSTPETR